MIIHSLTDLGDFGTDCYIIETSEKNAVLIDAPFCAELISAELHRLGLTLKLILLTHGHCDHTEALPGLLSEYGCELRIAPADEPMLRDSGASLASYFGRPFTPVAGALPLVDGECISVDDAAVGVIFTPGHSAGSVCYVCGGTVFSGDTLFRGTVGRTDLGGDFSELLRSVEKLSRLHGTFAVLPGHGEPTDLGDELLYNPYLEPLRR